MGETHRNSLKRRTFRRHAIETGIVERLYQIPLDLTETLVAEGLTREALARAGGELSPGVLEMLQAQMEGLEMVSEYVREGFQPRILDTLNPKTVDYPRTPLGTIHLALAVLATCYWAAGMLMWNQRDRSLVPCSLMALMR